MWRSRCSRDPQNLLHDQSQRNGIVITSTQFGRAGLPRALGDGLYRMTRRPLKNVARHYGREVGIASRSGREKWCLQVRDKDGIVPSA